MRNMEKISLNNLELGNLLWGHPQGKYLVPRDEWQDLFVDFLYDCGFDSYGHYKDKDYFANDTFEVHPYYWGDDETLIAVPNFLYKPMNFTIYWYKYPMRNAYASHNITVQEFEQILDKCYDSLTKERI